MTSPLPVNGGIGTLGRLVVPRLQEAGCCVRVLSQRSHESGDGIEFMIGDLATGAGLASAVDGSMLVLARQLAKLPVISIPAGFHAGRPDARRRARARSRPESAAQAPPWPFTNVDRC